MRILGIDPGLARIGLGLVTCTSPQDAVAEDWLVIETKAGVPLPDRLREIHADLTAYLAEKKPELVVVEKLFFAKNQTTALDVAHARGVILCTVAAAGIPILEPTPMQLKQGVSGDGGADKTQMQWMVARLLNLAAVPTPDDAADALALALYGASAARITTAHLAA